MRCGSKGSFRCCTRHRYYGHTEAEGIGSGWKIAVESRAMTPVHGYKIDIHAFEPVLEDVVGGREERKNRKIDAEIVLMMVKRDHRGIGNILSAIWVRSASGICRSERLWTLKSVKTSGRVMRRW